MIVAFILVLAGCYGGFRLVRKRLREQIAETPDYDFPEDETTPTIH